MLAVGGCFSCLRSPETYRVTLINTGTQRILVSDFKLYDSRSFSTVLGPELLPGQEAGLGAYSKRPFRQVVVDWKVMETGEVVKVPVEIELPEQFVNYASDVVFYIDPDQKRVYVAYQLHDTAKHKIMIVDSKGNPFDINQVKGAP